MKKILFLLIACVALSACTVERTASYQAQSKPCIHYFSDTVYCPNKVIISRKFVKVGNYTFKRGHYTIKGNEIKVTVEPDPDYTAYWHFFIDPKK